MIWLEVGKRIKTLRLNKKLTQAQFGKLIGVTSQHIGRIERGQKLSADLIAVICKRAGVTADYIIFGIADPLANIALLSELSPEQIDIGFDILKGLAKLVNTDNGNEILIKEIMRRQCQSVHQVI